MDDLAHWLGKQLDEDERIARAVEDRSAPWDGQWMADGNSVVRTFNGHVLFYRHGSGPLKPGLADHVAEWDPARVLREIEMKRSLVAAHERRPMPKGDTADCAQCWGAVWPCPTLRLLASVYDDRPGFQESWRP